MQRRAFATCGTASSEARRGSSTMFSKQGLPKRPQATRLETSSSSPVLLHYRYTTASRKYYNHALPFLLYSIVHVFVERTFSYNYQVDATHTQTQHRLQKAKHVRTPTHGKPPPQPLLQPSRQLKSQSAILSAKNENAGCLKACGKQAAYGKPHVRTHNRREPVSQ